MALLSYDMGRGVTAFSTMRRGGFSTGSYAELNINAYCGDDPVAVGRNRHLLCTHLGIADDRLLMPHQVHGTEVLAVDEPFMLLSQSERLGRLEGFDALMTDVAGVCIGVSTADCIPLLLYDRAHHAVCAVHAGWRGTVARIAMKAVRAMASAYGTDAAQMVAQIGPGIGLDSFEVGQEVYDAFLAAGFPMDAIALRYPARSAAAGQTKWHIDLPECNRRQLVEAGVPAPCIAMSGLCTYEHHDTFFSARRLGLRSGRIFTGIMVHAT